MTDFLIEAGWLAVFFIGGVIVVGAVFAATAKVCDWWRGGR
jgi:hypothetical protein